MYDLTRKCKASIINYHVMNECFGCLFRIGVASGVSMSGVPHHHPGDSTAVSGRETPVHFATEDTPANFSR